jgi:hypothetical protein
MCDVIIIIIVFVFVNEKETTQGHRSEFDSSDGVSCTCGLVRTGASEAKEKEKEQNDTKLRETLERVCRDGSFSTCTHSNDTKIL